MKRTLLLVLFIIAAVLLIGFFFPRLNPTLSPSVTPTPSTMVHKEDSLQVTPISHATMVLQFGGQIIYTDPVGGMKAFANQPAPTMILITDIHPDHLDGDTLRGVTKKDTVVVVPQAVFKMLPKDLQGAIYILHNGEKTTQKGILIEAIPMYNLPESLDAPHPKGRGNGYVISYEGTRVYIAGDTDATPEMKALKNIELAFIPMNPPFTMDVEEAAAGVLAFSPKIVHPYHYRTPTGFSDIKKFKQLVESKNRNIKVELLDFYPSGK